MKNRTLLIVAGAALLLGVRWFMRKKGGAEASSSASALTSAGEPVEGDDLRFEPGPSSSPPTSPAPAGGGTWGYTGEGASGEFFGPGSNSRDAPTTPAPEESAPGGGTRGQSSGAVASWAGGRSRNLRSL